MSRIRSKLGIVNTAFNQKIFDSKEDVYLDGYWQSEKYFSDFAEQIRKDFTLRNLLGGATQAMLTKIISDDQSVSLQIRRGDNAHSPSSMKTFGCPGIEYYESCIDALVNELKKNDLFGNKINLYVFSDEIDWAKENFHSRFPITFVTSRDIALCEEIALMKACKHNIISNSTFGWWGAWLNENPNKIVVAPKQWALLGAKNFRDLIPNGWIRI